MRSALITRGTRHAGGHCRAKSRIRLAASSSSGIGCAPGWRMLSRSGRSSRPTPPGRIANSSIGNSRSCFLRKVETQPQSRTPFRGRSQPRASALQRLPPPLSSSVTPSARKIWRLVLGDSSIFQHRTKVASSYLVEGDTNRAKDLAPRAWREFDFPAAYESGFVERFGSLLTEADHKWRFDRLLIDTPQWSSQRKERAAAAKRIIPLLSKAEQVKAE